MTVSSTPRKAGPFIGTGLQTSFPFAFKVFSENDLRVTLATDSQIEVELGSGDYTVTLNENQDTSPGGVIEYPLPSGYRLSVVGNLPYDQPLDLPSGGNFSPLALENELDRTVMQVQQLRETVGRSMLLPVTSTASTALPAPEADKYLGWNEDGSALVNKEGGTGTGGGGAAYNDMRFETFTGNGVAIAYSLTQPPIDLANTQVAVDGIQLVPLTDYNLSGSAVVFTVAPANGAEILVRYGRTVSAPPAEREVYRFLATAGQTTFTLAGGYPNNTNAVAVYVNGLRMEGGGIDYTEGTSTTITFASPLAEGDSVVCLVGSEPTGGSTGGGSGTVAWANVTGKPATFPPSAHTHVIGDVTGLTTTLNGKQATLVSGTNIKTINGTSILGSGNLLVGSGAGAGVTSFNTRTGIVSLTSADVVSALQTGANAAQVNITTTAPNPTSSSLYLTRNANYSGGTPGYVNSALFVDTNVAAGGTSFEWGITSRLTNYSNAGENVGGYLQGNKFASGPTWGGVAEVCDMTNINTTATSGAAVGLEVDVWCNGDDNFERRIGIDVVVSNAQFIRSGGTNSGIGKGVAYDGIRILAQSNNNALGEFKFGLNILSSTQAGIINQATGVWGIRHTGNYQVGIDLSGSNNADSAIRIKANDWIALDAFSAVKLRYNSSNGYIEFFNNSTRRGYINMTAGADSDLAAGGGSAPTNMVTTDTTQTITGTKTFTNTIFSNNGLSVNTGIVINNASATIQWPGAGNVSSTANGGGSTLPSTAAGFLRILIDGSVYKLPFYNN